MKGQMGKKQNTQGLSWVVASIAGSMDMLAPASSS